MSGNVFGLLFLVLGATGIVNAIYINQGKRWNGREDFHWYKPLHKKWNYQIQLQPPNFIHNNHPYLKEKNKPLHHQTGMKYNFQPNIGNDFHNFWSKHRKSSIFRLSEVEENSAENLVSSNAYFSGKNSRNSVEPKSEIQEDIYSDIEKKAMKHEVTERIPAKMASNNYERPILPNVDFNYEFLSVPVENSILELSTQLSEKQTDSTVNSSEFNTEIIKSENLLESEISKKMILQNNASNEKDSSTLHLEYRISESEKPSFTEEQTFSTETSIKNKKSQISSTLKPNIVTETESGSYPTDTRRSTSLKSNLDTSISDSKIPNIEERNKPFPVHSSTRSVETQSMDRKNSETESISPLNSISSKIIEDSEETADFFPTKSQNSVDENSVVSSTSTTEETTDISTTKETMSIYKKPVIPVEITEETTNDISSTETTTSTGIELLISLVNTIKEEIPNGVSSTEPTVSAGKESLVALSSIETTTDISTTTSTSSKSKDFLVSLKSTVAEVTQNHFSTNPAISEKESIPEAIPQDHVIKISSIRTARVVISTVFLVIALISITVLAIYVFQLKRKAVKYDQVLLLP